MKIKYVFLLLFSTPIFAEETLYTIPTPKEFLLKYNEFKIEVNCKKINERWQLVYTYPEELSGEKIEVVMYQSKFDPQFFFGSQSEMKCNEKDCQVHYFNLPFNEENLKNILKKQGHQKIDFDNRYLLALESKNDPGGLFKESPLEYCHFKKQIK